MEDYTNCVLIGGGDPRYLNISNCLLLLSMTLISTHVCMVAIVDCTNPYISTTKQFDCTHEGSATATFKD